jgi:NAD(P)-dependent dehydrogenase (short-subunit alcohol dehydrogenase family)
MRKIAIITGASSGIGGATAVALAERGVDSIVTFNSHEDRVRDVVEAIRQRGAKAVPLRLDVGESASFIAFREEVIAALDSEWKVSSFDYLVNNAGFLQIALFEDTTEELFDAYVRVLLKGPYFLTQAMLPAICGRRLDRERDEQFSLSERHRGGCLRLRCNEGRDDDADGLHGQGIQPPQDPRQLRRTGCDPHPYRRRRLRQVSGSHSADHRYDRDGASRRSERRGCRDRGCTIG